MTHLLPFLPSRTVTLDGNEYLYFGGTSYLGISRNAEFQDYLQEGFARYGTNYSSSRISNVQLAVFEEIESQLAAFTSAEAALTFSSGFLAGQALVRLLQTEGTLIYAPRTHPALSVENQSVTSQKYYAEWVQNLPSLIAETTEPHLILLVNSLDPLYAEKYDFRWLAHLPTMHQFTVVIDDSHGLGVIGQNGNGILSQLPVLPPHIEVLSVGSLGKALGLPGGVVLGSQKRIDQLRKTPFFTAGSPMPPAYAYAYLQAANLYDRLRKKLFENSIFFQQKTSATQLFRFFDAYPVFHTNQNGLYSHLQTQKMLISSFPYPSPHDSPITRVIINALHTLEDIENLATQIRHFYPHTGKERI